MGGGRDCYFLESREDVRSNFYYHFTWTHTPPPHARLPTKALLTTIGAAPPIVRTGPPTTGKNKASKSVNMKPRAKRIFSRASQANRPPTHHTHQHRPYGSTTNETVLKPFRIYTTATVQASARYYVTDRRRRARCNARDHE